MSSCQNNVKLRPTSSRDRRLHSHGPMPFCEYGHARCRSRIHLGRSAWCVHFAPTNTCQASPYQKTSRMRKTNFSDWPPNKEPSAPITKQPSNMTKLKAKKNIIIGPRRGAELNTSRPENSPIPCTSIKKLQNAFYSASFSDINDNESISNISNSESITSNTETKNTPIKTEIPSPPPIDLQSAD